MGIRVIVALGGKWGGGEQDLKVSVKERLGKHAVVGRLFCIEVICFGFSNLETWNLLVGQFDGRGPHNGKCPALFLPSQMTTAAASRPYVGLRCPRVGMGT